jgi:hypothetical protein
VPADRLNGGCDGARVQLHFPLPSPTKSHKDDSEVTGNCTWRQLRVGHGARFVCLLVCSSFAVAALSFIQILVRAGPFLVHLYFCCEDVLQGFPCIP